MNARRLALPLVAAAALVAHAASLADGFVFDDGAAVTHNPVVTGPLSLTTLLRRDFWGRPAGMRQSVGTWRPLPTLDFWLDWRVGGGRAWPFHAGNLLWHVLAALAFALALRRATGDERLAALVAALWALFGCNGEAVASVVGRADLMAAALSFAAFWQWRRRPALAVAAYAAACLCKESALVLPLWLFAVEALLAPPAERARPRAWLALVALAVAYVAVRALAFAPLWAVHVRASDNPLLGLPWAARLEAALGLFALALRVIVAPVALTADYAGWDPSFHGARVVWPVAGALALVALVAAAVAWRRRAPALAAGVALLLVAWAPVSNALALSPTLFAERLLYLPSAGVALVAGGALAPWWRRRPVVAAALFGALALFNLQADVRTDRRWHDNFALFSAAVEVAPGPRAWLNDAVELQRAGRLADAADAYRRSLALGVSPKALLGLAQTLDQLGRSDDAARQFRAALAHQPDDRETVRDAAIFYARHRRFADAAALLRPWLSRHPGDTELARLAADVDRAAAARP